MNIIRRGFDPAIRFLNHFTFPRKFFIAGTLVVLPLFFITWQYIETLSDRVEMAQQELVGNRAIRQLIPMWRTLRELRYESLVSRYESDAAEKPIAAICHGGWMAISAGVYRGVRVTGSPGIKDDLVNAGAIWEDKPVVVDRHFVSSRKPDDLPDFCRAILKLMA